MVRTDVEIDSLYDGLYERGRSAWPAVNLPKEAFARHLKLDDGDDPATIVAEDLYLACGCAHGDEAALRAFDEQYMSLVAVFVARIDASPDFVAEVRQRIRQRLLVRTAEAAPRIAAYEGRGKLASWLRVVALRMGLEIRRGAKPEVDVDAEASNKLIPATDPELDYLRARYLEPFQQAFRAALSALESRERTVLRLHLVDGLGLDKIAQLHDVHRVTVSRWLAGAREQLFDETRNHLRASLGLTDSEFNSLAGLVRSELDISLNGLLTSAGEG